VQRAAVGNSLAVKERPRALQYLRLIHQNPARVRRRLQHRGQHRADPACDVGVGGAGRPVHQRHARHRQELRLLAHLLAEQRLLVRMRGQVVPEGNAKRRQRGRLAGPQRLGQGMGDILHADRGKGRMLRQRMCPAQQAAPAGKANLILVQCHDAVITKQPQHPPQ
jgi:hypothetical protein